MKLKNFFKFTLGALFALPITLLFGSELFANNFSDNYQLQVSQEKLLACGGSGGGGSSPAARKAKVARQAKAKINTLKRILANQEPGSKKYLRTMELIDLNQQLIDEGAEAYY
tara:strand:- start:109 stop:447 length:339 start_codon:yes stop_codon:yes gene_type:complete